MSFLRVYTPEPLLSPKRAHIPSCLHLYSTLTIEVNYPFEISVLYQTTGLYISGDNNIQGFIYYICIFKQLWHSAPVYAFLSNSILRGRLVFGSSAGFPQFMKPKFSQSFRKEHAIAPKVKGKTVTLLSQVPHHENICGDGDIAPRILINFVVRCRWLVSFTTQPPYHGVTFI